ECIKTEEGAVAIYSRNIASTLSFSGLTATRQGKIKAILDILKNDTQKHREVFEQILKKIEGQEKDVY
ncbi:MAG: hypothetical protein PHR11_06540, partial [Candidatus Omnitrophica bacterium]|nr:hypothetical protein [Candidatus Omnitrophota bacterium]